MALSVNTNAFPRNQARVLGAHWMHFFQLSVQLQEVLQELVSVRFEVPYELESRVSKTQTGLATLYICFVVLASMVSTNNGACMLDSDRCVSCGGMP